MRQQTGVRVDAEVWRAYRELCSREKLRPSLPIEEFLRLVLEKESALSLLRLMRGVAKARAEGFDAYARVLLDWYTHGKYWFSVGDDDDVSVEALLLDSLKVVTDAELRRRIEKALVADQRKRYNKEEGASEVEKDSSEEPEADIENEKVEDSESVKAKEANVEKAEEILKEIKRLTALRKPEKEI
jgi:hypothetical protein